MPSKVDKIKRKLDLAKTKRAVFKEKVNTTKKELKKKYNVSTIKQAKELKKKLKDDISKTEEKANALLDEIEEQLEELETE